LNEVAIPLPSVREQLAIINEIEQGLSVAEEIEITIENNLKRAERMRQAILKKAFSGRLVRQANKSNSKGGVHYAK
jgi:type I restriction enzyme S subunit